jgi:hypothetical protein
VLHKTVQVHAPSQSQKSSFAQIMSAFNFSIFFSQSPKTRNKRVLVAKSKEKEGNKNKKVRQKGGADIGWSVTNVVKYN